MNEVIDAREALIRSAAGTLRDVRVSDDIDLAQLQTSSPTIVFEDVVFMGAVEGPSPVAIQAVNTVFSQIKGSSLLWPEPLTFDNVTFSGHLNLGGARFSGDWICRHCIFNDAVTFEGSVVEGNFRVLAGVFNGDFHSNFSRVRFVNPVSFQNTQFGAPALFQNSIFEQDVSFVGVEANSIFFVGAQFKGDAEFRSCRLQDGRFGLPTRANKMRASGPRPIDAITAFAGFTDFRRCIFGRASFDDALFADRVSFRGAHFGKGGLSFHGATADDEPFDMRAVTFEGPLDLREAILPNLEVRWPEVRTALDFGATDAETYRGLAGRLAETGAPIDALRAEYVAKQLDWHEGKALDVDRLTAGAEWLLWTWPTLNGTSLDRLVLVACGLWFLASLPLVFFARRLVVIPGSPPALRAATRPWQAIPTRALPEQAFCVIGPLRGRLVAFAFAFALMFKLSARSIRHVARSHDWFAQQITAYAFTLWVVGKGILALGVLTLANLSPPLRAMLPVG